MSSWRRLRLGDVLTLKRGYDLPEQNRCIGPVPIVSSSGTTGCHSEAKVKGPGVVTGRYGTLGQVFYIDRDFWPLNTTLYVVDFKGNDPRFVAYMLRTLAFDQQNVAGAVPGVNRNYLHEIPVSLPSTAVQRRIASILSVYDDLIENNLRRIKILEDMAQSLYKEWFVDFRFPGHEDIRMVGSSLGMIPEGWEVACLKDHCTTQYGYTESARDDAVGPKFLRGMDINKSSYIDWDGVPYCSISDQDVGKFHLQRGDVVMIRMADPGKVGIVETAVDAVFASYLVRLRPMSERTTPYYLFYLLLGDTYQDYIQGASGGTTRRSASATVMTQFEFFLPPMHLVTQFDETVGELRGLLNVLVGMNGRLRQTRDLLLPKLISGEIDVSDLDIDVGEDAA